MSCEHEDLEGMSEFIRRWPRVLRHQSKAVKTYKQRQSEGRLFAAWRKARETGGRMERPSEALTARSLDEDRIAGDPRVMARSRGHFRNPRFAPEFLEKRLSPSSVLPTVTVQVAKFDDPEPLPEPCPGLPPLPPPPLPPLPILPR